jgi:pimeloyl-ACP methyl ester carboxylesterase
VWNAAKQLGAHNHVFAIDAPHGSPLTSCVPAIEVVDDGPALVMEHEPHHLARISFKGHRIGVLASEAEAKELYETFAVPASGKPLFQAAIANLNPWTEAKVDTENPSRGPLLIIGGEKDHTAPWAIAHASFKRQKRNRGVTEIVEIKKRGHALTIDHGWRDVADTALAFIRRFV